MITEQSVAAEWVESGDPAPAASPKKVRRCFECGVDRSTVEVYKFAPYYCKPCYDVMSGGLHAESGNPLSP